MQYQPGGEVQGPNALAVLPDGIFVLADLYSDRLLQFDPAGKWVSTIDLSALDIRVINDLRAAGGNLFVLEITQQYRIQRLSPDGKLLNSYDLPPDLTLKNGLTGIAIGGAGEILAELYNGDEYYQLVDAHGNLAPTPLAGYPYGDRIYQVQGVRITAGDIRVETQLTNGYGSLTLLGVLPNGSFYAVREDVVSSDSPLQVDQTVHLIDAQGKQVGVARVPLTERLYWVHRQLALGPDGAVYALLPRADTIDVLRLNFFNHLEPLIPGAQDPQVKLSTQ